GPTSGAATASGSLVSSDHQSKDVQLDEEATRAPRPAPADQTLSQGGRSGYLTGIEVRPSGRAAEVGAVAFQSLWAVSIIVDSGKAIWGPDSITGTRS